MGIRCWVTAFLLTLAINVQGAGEATRDDSAFLEDKLGYHIGLLAYIYGYPMVDMLAHMHNDTHIVSESQSTYAPVNHFYRFDELVTPETAGHLRAPNADVLYFAGWFDVSTEPAIIHNPDTDGRYFTMAITDLHADVMHLGRRTIGTEEQYHALVGPQWKGKLPSGVIPVPVDTNQVFVLGQLAVEGPDDLPTATALLEQFWASSMTLWRRNKPPRYPEPEYAEAIAPLDNLAFFRMLNQALIRNPQRPGEEALMALFDMIDVGPLSDFHADKLPEAVRESLQRAIEDGSELVRTAARDSRQPDESWATSHLLGRHGYNYLQRAAAVEGGYFNLPAETLYAISRLDDQRETFRGDRAYSIHFAADKLPPVNGFWSVSAYQATDAALAPNTLQRYSIGDRTAGLSYGEDGSLTLLLQHAEPEAADQANWLPTPGGEFFVVVRMYEPRTELLQDQYNLPPIKALYD